VSLYSDLNELKELISSGIIIKEYTSDWVEAYIPEFRRLKVSDQLKKVARYLEEKYSRPVHIYVAKNKCMIRLR
jgi:predicted AAA+ superfamily ATPase